MKCAKKKKNALNPMEFKQTDFWKSYSTSIAQQVFFEKVQVQ